MTRLIRGLCNILPQDQGGVLAIGNFDGVHLGHQSLLELLKIRAREFGSFSMVMAFEPQPLEYYMQDKLTVPRLMCMRDKYWAINRGKIDKFIVVKFNQQFAQLSPEDFVQQILVKCLKIKHVIVGEDFRFGHKRSGDVKSLQLLGSYNDFTVEIIPAVVVAGKRVSSTLLRETLAGGAFQQAYKYLGCNYTMGGRVVVGKQLGSKLGFPTANISIRRMLAPFSGVYAVLVKGLAPGVANIGVRPTIDGGGNTVLEVHLLNFSQNIYGQYIEVEFLQKLRNELKFSDVEALQRQIAEDIVQAREYFMVCR